MIKAIALIIAGVWLAIFAFLDVPEALDIGLTFIAGVLVGAVGIAEILLQKKQRGV